MRELENIKISQEITRDELIRVHAPGINFTAMMVNAMLDGIKSHTSRKAMRNGDSKNPYPVGKLMFVRETVIFNPETKEKLYIADLDAPGLIPEKYKGKSFSKKASFFVPRDVARIAIRVTQSELKPLQKLTHEERIAEGLLIKEIDSCLHYFDYDMHFYKFNLKKMGEAEASFNSFKSLWIKIHGRPVWDENPNIWSLYYEPLLIV
jgi:hypothetical protein